MESITFGQLTNAYYKEFIMPTIKALVEIYFIIFTFS